MTTYTAKFNELPKYLREGDQDFWSIQATMEGDDDILEDKPRQVVEDYMTANPLSVLGALWEARAYPKGGLQSLWEGYGIFIDDEKQIVTFTADALNAAFLMCRRVFNDYGTGDEDNTGSWEELRIGGDDSVDYWGGYLHSFLVLLADHAKAQGATGIDDTF